MGGEDAGKGMTSHTRRMKSSPLLICLGLDKAGQEASGLAPGQLTTREASQWEHVVVCGKAYLWRVHLEGPFCWHLLLLFPG